MVERYNVDSGIESSFVLLLCSRPAFFGRFAKAVDPEALDTEPARLLAASALQYHHQYGVGPSSANSVFQSLRCQVMAGRVQRAQLVEAMDYIAAAEDAVREGRAPNEADLIAQFTPVLRKRAEHPLIMRLMEAHNQRRSLMPVLRELQELQQLGLVDALTSVSSRDSANEIRAIRHLERLSTGIPELDTVIGGGLGRRQLGVVIGSSGDGKSMLLAHQAADAAASGLLTLYATLELPKAYVMARINANLVQLPINSMLNDDDVLKEADRRMAYLELNGLVHYEVKDFTAHSTPISAVATWVDMVEQKYGRKVDVLVTDYADKFSHGQGSMYEGMREVYEGLRHMAVDRNLWSWTASQARRRSRDKRTLDIDDGADSQHKVRVADMVLTLNMDFETKELRIYVAKNRTGEGQQTVGPLPTAFEEGRVAPLANYRMVF